VVLTQQACFKVASVIEELSLLFAFENGKEYYVHSGYATSQSGEISRLIIATIEDDAAFKTLLKAQQTAINTAYDNGRESTTVMFICPTEIPTGPSSTFAVIHPTGSAEAQVVCIHALRAYHLGSLIPAGTDPGLVSKMFGVVGEIIIEDGTTILPRCLLQPDCQQRSSLRGFRRMLSVRPAEPPVLPPGHCLPI
jgi:hypothetical protein